MHVVLNFPLEGKASKKESKHWNCSRDCFPLRHTGTRQELDIFIDTEQEFLIIV